MVLAARMTAPTSNPSDSNLAISGVPFWGRIAEADLSLVEVERPVDRRTRRPVELAVPVEERRGAVRVVDRGPVELAIAVRVRLRPTVVEHRTLVLAVRAVHRRLAGVRRPQRHEDDEDHDADERH